MNFRLSVCALFACLGVASAQEGKPTPAPSPETAPSLRAQLLEFGGALANDGFRLRDSFWSGRLESGRPRRLAVNLFSGNKYWFCAAVAAPGVPPAISLFDPRGEAVDVQTHRDTGLSAAGVTAETTGRYVLEIKAPRGPAADFCLLYLFK
jgi:hypothetical protein